MTFEFALENEIVGYLKTVVDSSMSYPILVGHTPVTNSFEHPKIAVLCENWTYVNQVNSPRKCTVNVDIVSEIYDEDAYSLHSFACDEIEQSMNNLPALVYVNFSNPSASAWIVGMEYGPVSCPVNEGKQYLNSYSYTVFAQNLKPSSSVIYC